MSAPLHYAPPLPWHRAGRTQRTILRLLILSAIACGGIWAFRFAQQLHFLYQQHQWMQYTMPADRVVLENSSTASELLRAPGYHFAQPGIGDPGHTIVADPPHDIAPLPWAVSSTVVYLHHQRATGGHERLVSVVLGPQPDHGPSSLTGWGGAQPWAYGGKLIALAQMPGDLRLGSQPTPCAVYDSGEVSIAGRFRLFAGQPDPADESHFTIRYELDGKPNIIDGWLMPDDTVKLEPRH
jgi:hypothetical protein